MPDLVEPVSFASALEKFLKSLKSQSRSSATIVAYAGDLKQIQDYFAAKRITQATTVTSSMLQEYVDSLFANGYTPKSVSRKINSLKTFFKFLQQNGMNPVNPSSTINHPKFEIAPPRILTSTEFKALRDACRLDIRMAAVIEILLQTGIRISELANLHLDDIKKNEVIIRALENNPQRVVPLSKNATSAIQNYLAIRPKITDTHLFVTKTGHPLLVRNIRTAIDRYFKQAGIRNAKVNDLRHTFIAFQLEQGVSAELVYRIVGHRRATSTEKYFDHIKSPVSSDSAKLVEL